MNIEALINSIPGGIAQGLMWGILALGVFMSYKLLDFADLTVDGSLATGGVVAAVLIDADVYPLLAMLIATAAGGVAGLITALLNTKLKIPPILSGIITMSALYSINLHVLSGKAYLSIGRKFTLNDLFANITGLSSIDDKNVLSIISCVILIGLLIGFFYWFFGTEFGCAIRATGNNAKMARAQGINTDNTKIVTLMISNGLAALAGSVIAQHGFGADVNMASGTIVIGLASVIIGEVIFPEKLNFALKLLGVVVGSIIYRLIFTFAVQLGMNTNDLKLIASIIIVLALCMPLIKKKFSSSKATPISKS